MRNYIFWLKPINENQKIDSTKEINLGKLDLHWRNYFGDPGSLCIGPYRAMASRGQREVDIQPVMPTVLKMEQSQLITFRLYNLSDKPMNLKIELKEGTDSKECLITDVEPSVLGQIDPMKFCDFSLQLFPKICGVAKLSGLFISDSLTRKLHDFWSQPFAQMTVEY